MVARPYLFAIALAAAVSGLAIVVAVAMDLPLHDPDGLAGPAYIRLPAVVAFFLLVDIAPRALKRTRHLDDLVPAAMAVVRERWSRSRLTMVLVGLGSFYVTYVGYRNLKSFLPLLTDDLHDNTLLTTDRVLFFGNDPAEVLHELLGTGASAQVLSWAYLIYLVFVPLSLGAALVWSRDMVRAAWYVTALNINWALGVVSYYLVPSRGPVYAAPANFWDLPETGVASLQQGLLNARFEVLFDPQTSSAISGIAAFASLHVSVVFTAALIAHRLGMRPVIRWALWAYTALTILSTIYFGWHYVLDDVAGIAIGWVAVEVGARVTGANDRWQHRSEPALVGSGAARS
jgi:membrane-associated phospholipid phosphatase